ncbi:(2Fe-2S)-binding protein [Streptomyces sp. NBC_00162]|uniref:(2Fe-2S)-binding protein n=1 Tax=Streptomyces sp. NBC_00162 TaxID=2903629 RepID=UPI00214BD4D0|nr:(2Fe-2S)-binding protein [Streptomyces sp. NBC_00162]UUU42401.1 (2Fe-2S)-binding protein [Streptomyces sp. NBC_00162]
MYVCSCFGITDKQVKDHAAAGACTPRQIASATKAGTECGSCVRAIQGILGRGACPRRELMEKGNAAAVLAADVSPATAPVPSLEPVLAEAA